MLCAITNRRRKGGAYTGEVAGDMAYHLAWWHTPSEAWSWDPMGRRDFHREILTHLREEIAKGKTPLVVCVVHGFNVSWSAGLDLFASVHAALQPMIEERGLHPVVVGYGWPSDGKVGAYLDDRQAARLSAEALAGALYRTLALLEREQCAARLAVVAHSMGTYLLAQAAARVWEARGKPSDLRLLSEVLLLAADLDGEALEPGGEALPLAALARRITVYSSRRDGALLASTAKRGGVTGARLGRQGVDRRSVPGCVCGVDCSAVASGHSSYFSEPAILADIRATLAGIDRRLVPGRRESEAAGVYTLGRA